MKKMNNKGFSLVELIIVIAIMAILAGALAPALIKYIAKSRRSSDANNCGTIQSSMQTATSDENAADDMGTAYKADTWTQFNTTNCPTSNKYWSVVDADLSGGIAAFGSAKTNKTAKSGDKISGATYYFKVTSAGDVHVGIKGVSGGTNTNTNVLECVPALDEEMGGKTGTVTPQ